MRLCPQSFRLYLKKHSAKTKFPLFSYLISFLSKSWYKQSHVAHVDLPCRWRLVLCLCRGCHRIQSIYSATQVNFRNRKQSKPALQFKAPVQPGAPKQTGAAFCGFFFSFFFLSLCRFFERELASVTFNSRELRSILCQPDSGLSEYDAFTVFPETLQLQKGSDLTAMQTRWSPSIFIYDNDIQ